MEEQKMREFKTLVKLRSNRLLEHLALSRTGKKLFLSSGVAEEAGEILGAIRKLMKGFNQKEIAKLRKKKEEFETMPEKDLEVFWENEKNHNLREEIADCYIMLIALSEEIGMDLEEYTLLKFNEDSEKLGFTDLKINL